MPTTSALPSVREASSVRRRPISVDEYHRMGEIGILTEDDRVELIDGQLIAMSPIGAPHLHCINRLNRLFASRVYSESGDQALLSVQNSIRLDDTTEPEPDVALLRLNAPQSRIPTPDDVLLVVEVADSSLDYDRDVKTPLYAAAGIPAYWIVDLNRGVVDASLGPDGDSYAERRRYRRGEAVPLPEALDADPMPVHAIVGESPDVDADA